MNCFGKEELGGRRWGKRGRGTARGCFKAPRATDGGETFEDEWKRQGEPFPALVFRRPSALPSLRPS